MAEPFDAEPPGPGHPRPTSDLTVVGLGASAGGIRALQSFFSHLPRESGAAYVVILHLSPDHDSKLAHILQVSAKIPVTEVKATVKLRANQAYVISPNKSLAID